LRVNGRPLSTLSEDKSLTLHMEGKACPWPTSDQEPRWRFNRGSGEVSWSAPSSASLPYSPGPRRRRLTFPVEGGGQVALPFLPWGPAGDGSRKWETANIKSKEKKIGTRSKTMVNQRLQPTGTHLFPDKPANSSFALGGVSQKQPLVGAQSNGINEICEGRGEFHMDGPGTLKKTRGGSLWGGFKNGIPLQRGGGGWSGDT